jgi:DNA-binding NtrC family response regulator
MARILIIDDDAVVGATGRTMLTPSGYETGEAGGGREGSLLLDGVDLLGTIRRQGRTVPVIAMSGGGKVDSKSYLEVAKALGAYATIAKPFDLEHFLSTVRDALASRGTP